MEGRPPSQVQKITVLLLFISAGRISYWSLSRFAG